MPMWNLCMPEVMVTFFIVLSSYQVDILTVVSYLHVKYIANVAYMW